MASSFGDLVLDLMGQPDPRRNLAAALSQGIGMGQPAPAANGGQDGGGLANMTAQAPAPQQQQQQQPDAYKSPPDIASTLFELQRRQNSEESINRGLGLLLGGFARPEDRGPMLQAMSGLSGGGGGTGATMSNIVELYGHIQQMQAYRQQLGMAPIYAKQLGMPVEQIIAYIQAGKLPEIMQAVNQKHMELADPLHIAQVAAAQAGTAKTAAETGAIPGQIAKTVAETAAIPGQIAKTAAETGAIPAQIAKTQAETEQAQAQTEKLAAEAQARRKLAALVADPNFATKYGMTPEAALALPPDELAKVIATPAQVTAQTTAKISAEDMATAKAGLPAAELKAREAMNDADAVANDPNLQHRTGPQSYFPALGGTWATTQAKIDKLAGTSGVAAVDALKGGVGRILGSEFSESEKAQSLLSHQHMPTEDYRQGVIDFKKKIGAQIAGMYQKAGLPVPDYYQPYIQAPSSPAPTTNAPARIWKRNPQTNKLEQQ